MKRLQLCDVHLFVVMSPRLLLLTPFSHKQTKSCYKKNSIVSRDNSNHKDYELAWLREANLCGVIFSFLQELICAGCNIRKKKKTRKISCYTPFPFNQWPYSAHAITPTTESLAHLNSLSLMSASTSWFFFKAFRYLSWYLASKVVSSSRSVATSVRKFLLSS